MSRYSDDAIKNMIKLKNLNISYFTSITDEGIKNMKDMKKLYLYRCDAITDDGIKNMKLNKLCTNMTITAKGIKHMQDSLQILDIQFPNNHRFCRNNILKFNFDKLDLDLYNDHY